MERVLITGVSGYVGSHIAKYLSMRGYEVYGLDRNPKLEILSKYIREHLQCDIADKKLISPFLKKNQIQSVIHCAAKCLVGESMEKPDLYEDHNFRRACVFFDACLASGVSKFNLSSTAAVYGEPRQTPIPETHLREPINPYGKTKMMLEDYLLKAGEKKRMKVGILRYFNVAGADPDAEIGEVHDPETHLIPNAIFAALRKKPSFHLFGKDYPTTDGTCVRDYIHVMDLALGHALLLEKLNDVSGPLIFNLGTREGYSVKEVLDEIDRQTGEPMKREFSPRRPGDPSILVADSNKARKELGWQPKYSDLKTIVETALRWHKSR